jgi:phenylacetate-CoA ligase
MSYVLRVAVDAYATKRAGPRRIAQQQRRRFADLIAFAREHSAFYRALYASMPEKLQNFSDVPVTDKRMLMGQFDEWVTDPSIKLREAEAFINDPQLIGEQFKTKYTLLTTSGTTGARGIFAIDQRSMAVTTALALRMLSGWLGFRDAARAVAARARMAMIMATGGHFASAVAAARLKARRGSAVEVLSVHTPVQELVRCLNAFQPALLATYASMGALLADEAEAGRLNIRPALVSVTAEGLPAQEYKRVAAAFNAPVGNSYASTECPFFSYSCDHGWLHANGDWVMFEPVDEQYRPVAPGTQSHTVLVSNLANRVQPIIRYDLGDSILQSPDPCPCGNPLPAIRVQGRVADVLTFRTTAGVQVTLAPLAFGTVLDGIPGLELVQVAQQSDLAIRVRFLVRQGAAADRVWSEVEGALQGLFGRQGLSVAIERGSEPPERSPGGKYRAVIPKRERNSDGMC